MGNDCATINSVSKSSKSEPSFTQDKRGTCGQGYLGFAKMYLELLELLLELLLQLLLELLELLLELLLPLFLPPFSWRY